MNEAKAREIEERARGKAKDNYGSNEIEIDVGAEVSIGDEGAWVRAWVFVPNDELGIEGGD